MLSAVFRVDWVCLDLARGSMCASLTAACLQTHLGSGRIILLTQQ